MTTNRLPQQADNDDETSAFLKIPKEVRKKIYSRCHLPRAFGLFALTSKQIQQETAFLQLWPSAVNAEPESYEQKDATQLKMITILKEHWDLLFKKATIENHNGQVFFASPYQLLLGSGDIWAQRKVHEEILPNIVNGIAIAEEQFREQFPNCPWPFNPDIGEEALYDERNKEQIKQVIAQLQIISAQITLDPCTNGEATLPETREAVEALWKIFAAKEGEIIGTGLHFPQKIMEEIYKVYDALIPRTVDRLSFFSRTVIGKAIAASTVVDSQCYKGGLKNLDMEKGPDRRDGVICKRPLGIPEKSAPIHNKLGDTVFLDPYDGYSYVRSLDEDNGKDRGVLESWYNNNSDGVRQSAGASCCVSRVGGAACMHFGKLMENKSRKIWELLCSDTQKSQHMRSMTITNRSG